ncbi:hypothetical protein ACFOEZ_04140 [Tianweitania populi]|uniref:Uncharacterized protein n=1 Tax=Tianweitania populi TaxID=1607949 RepID=A0A8J3DLH4_9HYPH|nr:hypothetical protein [Tianweitania populi]GHD07713.1 hypothetical protein GCM10016234_06450 [Tianweitania populi]
MSALPKKKTKIGGQFVAHLREMRNSLAWWMLTGNDKLVLEAMEDEHLAHASTQNGKLAVTYDAIAARGARRQSIAKAIARVEALGFVECTHRGRAAQAEYRFPATYRLTYVTGNLDGTHEWRRITSQAHGEARIAAAMQELEERSRPLRQRLQRARVANAPVAEERRKANANRQ